MNRIINIYKPKGITSNGVVTKVKKILNMKKVGHTGTLDPDACGVLPICLGRATKVCELIVDKEKTYVCEMRLGIETDTYDSSGEILKTIETDNITNEDIKKAFESQVGDISQYPPKYSALKVKGKRMCDLVRAGRGHEIKLQPRNIKIHNIEILKIQGDFVTFSVNCSKGTYVRSICHDIGQILGVGGNMTDLERTKSGNFTVENSITLEELEVFKKENSVENHSFEIEFVLMNLKKIMLVENAVKYYSNGGIIYSDRFNGKISDEDKIVRVYSKDGFIGTGSLIREEDKLAVKNSKLFNI